MRNFITDPKNLVSSSRTYFAITATSQYAMYIFTLPDDIENIIDNADIFLVEQTLSVLSCDDTCYPIEVLYNITVLREDKHARRVELANKIGSKDTDARIWNLTTLQDKSQCLQKLIDQLTYKKQQVDNESTVLTNQIVNK